METNEVVLNYHIIIWFIATGLEITQQDHCCNIGGALHKVHSRGPYVKRVIIPNPWWTGSNGKITFCVLQWWKIVSIRQIFNCNFFIGCRETPKRISQLMERRNDNMKDVLRLFNLRQEITAWIPKNTAFVSWDLNVNGATAVSNFKWKKTTKLFHARKKSADITKAAIKELCALLQGSVRHPSGTSLGNFTQRKRDGNVGGAPCCPCQGTWAFSQVDGKTSVPIAGAALQIFARACMLSNMLAVQQQASVSSAFSATQVTD